MAMPSWTAVIGIASLLIAAFLFYHTFDDAYAVSIITAGRGPVFFPRILLAVMLLLSAAVIYEGWRTPFVPISKRQFLFAGAALGLTGIYIYAITAAGFLISTTFYIFMLPWLLGYRNAVATTAIAAVYPVTVWFIFEKFFKIILPSSPWFDAF